MPLTIETVKAQGRLVADNDTYRIHDFDLGDLTISVTELKKGQATRGHSHDGNAEAYFFMEGGDAEMTVGKQSFEVSGGAVLIPKGAFHKVSNKSNDSELSFISVFAGKRGQSKVIYSGEGRGAGRQEAKPPSPGS